jgi:hypothetical protein
MGGDTADVFLPAGYRIMPREIPFFVPGFEGQSRSTDFVLSPEETDCNAWFNQFTQQVADTIGSSFLPVCRMSDGEFMLLFGHQSPSLRHSPAKRIAIYGRQLLGRLRRRLCGFRAATAKGVSSGNMTYTEYVAMRPLLSEAYASIARHGILGLHLSYGKTPFQEQFFPAIGKWLTQNSLQLSLRTYVPFYFVYALLRGPRFSSLVGGRRVLVVHSAAGPKREAIVRSLLSSGARSVDWLPISASRSFADTLDLARVGGRPELCLVGAGLGKSRILQQLQPLAIPCIDAGYAFEVWADPDRQWDRPYMTPDAALEVDRIRFLSSEDRARLRAVQFEHSL